VVAAAIVMVVDMVEGLYEQFIKEYLEIIMEKKGKRRKEINIM